MNSPAGSAVDSPKPNISTPQRSVTYSKPTAGSAQLVDPNNVAKLLEHLRATDPKNAPPSAQEASPAKKGAFSSRFAGTSASAATPQRDFKFMLQLLDEVLGDFNDIEWAADIWPELIPYLLDDLMPELNDSPSELQVLKRIHAIVRHALLPVESRPASDTLTSTGPSPRSGGQPERSAASVEINPAVSATPNKVKRWLKTLLRSEESIQRGNDAHRRAAAIRTAGAFAASVLLDSEQRRYVAQVANQVLSEHALRASAPPPPAPMPTSPDTTPEAIPDPHIPTSETECIVASQPAGKGGRGSLLAKKNSKTLIETAVKRHVANTPEDEEAIELTEAALSACCRSLPESLLALEEAAPALGAFRGEVSMLAVNFFAAAAEYDKIVVRRELVTRFPTGPGTLDISSAFGARVFCGLCVTCHDGAAGPKDPFFVALAALIRDPRPFVYLEAATQLAKFPWTWLVAHTLPPRPFEHRTERERRQAAGSKFIPELAYKLNECLTLGSSSFAAQTEAFRVVVRLCQSRSEHASEGEDDPFFPLSTKAAAECLSASDLLNISSNATESQVEGKTCRFLKLAAARALAWTGKPGASLTSKLCSIRLAHAQDTEYFLEALFDRSKSNPLCIPTLLRCAWVHRAEISPRFLLRAWTVWGETFDSRASLTNRGVLTSLCSFHDWIEMLPFHKRIEREKVLLEILNEYVAGIFKNDVVAQRSLYVRAIKLCFGSARLETRKAAALFLGRFLLCSDEPVRFEGYEALRSMQSDGCFRDIVTPYVSLLDRVYGFLHEAKALGRLVVVAGHAVARDGLGERHDELVQAAAVLVEKSFQPKGFTFLLEVAPEIVAAAAVPKPSPTNLRRRSNVNGVAWLGSVVEEDAESKSLAPTEDAEEEEEEEDERF